MAITSTHLVSNWDTFHQNGPFPAKMVLSTKPEARHIIPVVIDRYNDTADEIRRLIGDAVTNNERFRPYGSTWSLNNIAHQQDRMHHNAFMNIKMDIAPADVHQLSPYAADNLFFFQCGNTIKEISRYLFDKGKSLKTSGASNGQTIAGGISTGIHGSAIDVGSVQDYVVGINLITGPASTDVVYIERHTKPALNNAFAAKIKSRVIRNDELFNAALVGLGSFGFIHGVVLEAENLFLLKRYVKYIKRTEALDLAENMDFPNSTFFIPSEKDSNGNPLRPYHFKVYVNPYNPNEDYVAEVIYKKPFTPGYPDPIPSVRKAVYKELPDFMVMLAAKYNRVIPLIINAMKSTLFPTLDSEATGTLGEIFWDSLHKGKAFAVTIGIDNKATTKALDTFLHFVNTEGPVPGAIAFRFVKATEATLGFTKYPITCILEMDGVLWDNGPGIISYNKFLTRFIEVFQQANISFTMHWGKNADWTFPGLVDYMFGNKKNEWINARCALLTQQMADVFSNDFLDSTGLSNYNTAANPALIVSLDKSGAVDPTV
ncbi:MAG: FAD-binding protein [Taibaiella sp.]|nr:FAD-binding protein [Taibaiella sp.]